MPLPLVAEAPLSSFCEAQQPEAFRPKLHSQA